VTKPKIVIANWDQILHKFTDGRRPIWVKLYLALLGKRDWRQLSGDAGKLYIDLVMLAAQEEPYGSVSLTVADLAYEVRLMEPEVLKSLLEVVKSDLITASGYEFDVKMISDGRQDDVAVSSEIHQDDALEERRVEESREETTSSEEKGWSDRVLHVDLDELALFCRDFGIPYAEMNDTLKRLDATKLLPLDA
jgi:hypothetical protein